MAKKPHFRLVPYRLLSGIDWPLIIVTILLVLFGIATLWGATSAGNGPGWPMGVFAIKQSIFAGLGIIIMFGLIFFDYRNIRRNHWFIWILYAGLIILLLGLFLKHGHSAKGAESWYDLGIIKLQPAELGKIVLVLVLAHYLSSRMKEFRGLRHTIVPLIIVGIPQLLILKQPDLGTAIVMIPLAASMFWVAGLRKWVIIAFALLGLSGAVLYYPHLEPHQKKRIETFMNPGSDPKGKDYNIIQAQTALGSGKMFGKGWGRGTQTTYRYLPEFHTDFIFPTVGEQFGLVGCVLVLILQSIFILRMVRLASVTQNLFGVLIITGLTAVICTHIILNIGMVVGVLPVTGLPLPFFSYGGSFMITCMISVGLVLSIGARRGL